MRLRYQWNLLLALTVATTGILLLVSCSNPEGSIDGGAAADVSASDDSHHSRVAVGSVAEGSYCESNEECPDGSICRPGVDEEGVLRSCPDEGEFGCGVCQLLRRPPSVVLT